MQLVSAKLRHALIITRSHICVPFSYLRIGSRIAKSKILLTFSRNCQQKGFEYETELESYKPADYQKVRVLEGGLEPFIFMIFLFMKPAR